MSASALPADHEDETPADILRAHLRALARYALGILGTVFAFGFFGEVSGMFGFLLAIFGLIPLALIFAAVGILHIVQGIREAFRVSLPPRIRTALCLSAPLTAVAIVLLAWPAIGGGSLLATYGRFAIRYSDYQTIIDRAHRGQADDRVPFRGVRYQIDPGPPLRVAFEGDGMLDNWSGIVFDPTGEVKQARGFDAQGNFHAPARITKIFGGDLVSCGHLWGNYYDCSFT